MFARTLQMPRFRHRNRTPKKPAHEPKTEMVVPEPPDPVEVQVAVMVAMPRKPEENNHGDATQTEYAFGVTEVLYPVRTPLS